MARDISIAISAKDNFSSAITTMRNANQAFSKDVTGLQSKIDALNKTKIALKVDTNKARNELKEAEKQFAKTGEAADKMKLEMANSNYENARRNLSLVSDNAKQAEKDIRSLTNAVSKTENRATSAKNVSSGILNTLAYSGAASLIGNTISSIANVGVSSAFGQEAGIVSNSVLSTGAMGAAIGSAIAPGIGTAIGALGGAVLGYIQGQSAIFENKDQAFKNYYEDTYNKVLNTQSTALTSGSGIASARETNKISFSTLLGGDKKANSYLKNLTKFAADTPFEYDDLTKISKTLLAYKYKQNEIFPLLTKVGDTGSALGMTTEDMTWVATSLGRMKSTGKTTLEYLNPLLERGIPVWDYLAKASGKTNKEVQDMVSKGLVPGEQAAKAITDYMGSEFAGNMEKQSQTYAGLVSTLEDGQTALDNAMGEGYNDTRKSGLQDQIDWLSGESGQEMQGAYKQIGQWKASLENLAEEYQRDALNTVMTGATSTLFNSDTQSRLNEMYGEYTKYASDGTEEAGAKMGELLAEAQAIAQNEYNASEGSQLALQSNKDLAERIKNDASLQENYWDAGYEMGLQFSKGLASAFTSTDTNKLDTLTPQQKEFSDRVNSGYYGAVPRGHAYGMNYVPYDNYPAMLHQGERVLTASENRNHGNAAPITITGNNFTVREEADITKIAQEIARQIGMAYQLAV